MRIGLTILAAWAICLVSAPRPAPANQKAPDSAKQNAQPHTQPTKPFPLGTQENSAQNPANQKSANVGANPDVNDIRIVGLPKRSTGETVALICTVILTLAGIVGIIAAFRTLKAIEKQAGAMVAAERAWVIAELVPKRFENMDEDLIYHLRVTNMGRTPAFVTKYAISSSRSDKKGIVQQGLVAFDFPHRSLKAGGKLTFRDRPINLTAHIEDGNVALVFFGSVTYQHVFDHSKFVEEPFCYAFDAETTTLKRAPTPNPNEQKKAN